MKYVDVVQGKMGGKPCLIGTRFPIYRLLAELSEGNVSVEDVAKEYDLTIQDCKGAMAELSILFENGGNDLFSIILNR